MPEPFDTAEAARAIGLTCVTVADLVWTRETNGSGDDLRFTYRNARGRAITNPNAITRLNGLAIPPAYRDVRVSPDPNSHLQAVGTDDAGRVQYRYHPDWDRVREQDKAIRLQRLIRALPAIRRRVEEDLEAPGTPKRKALAAAVRLIDRAHVRVGNDGYLKAHRTHGATTLLKSHIKARGKALALRFTGKSGKRIAKKIEASGLARALRSLARLPGRRAFQYRDEEGQIHAVSAADVNACLADIAGAPVTAKDFRTLAGSARAAEALAEMIPAETESRRRRQVSGVIKDVAERLFNTPAVARRSYVHDAVIESFEDGTLAETYAGSRAGNEVSRAERTLAKVVAANPSARSDASG